MPVTETAVQAPTTTPASSPSTIGPTTALAASGQPSQSALTFSSADVPVDAKAPPAVPTRERSNALNQAAILKQGAQIRKDQKALSAGGTGRRTDDMDALINSPQAGRQGIATDKATRAAFEAPEQQLGTWDKIKAFFGAAGSAASKQLEKKNLAKTAVKAVVPFANTGFAAYDYHQAGKNLDEAKEVEQSIGSKNKVASTIAASAHDQASRQRSDARVDLAAAALGDTVGAVAGPLAGTITNASTGVGRAAYRFGREKMDQADQAEAREKASQGDAAAQQQYARGLGSAQVLNLAASQASTPFAPRSVTSQVQAANAPNKAARVLGIGGLSQAGLNAADTKKGQAASAKARRLLGIEDSAQSLEKKGVLKAPDAAKVSQKDVTQKSVLMKELAHRRADATPLSAASAKTPASLKPSMVAASVAGNAAGQRTMDTLDARQVAQLEKVQGQTVANTGAKTTASTAMSGGIKATQLTAAAPLMDKIKPYQPSPQNIGSWFGKLF